MGQIATLGGEPLLDRRDVSWSLTTGTSPHMEAFELEASAANRLLQATIKGTTVDLIVIDSGFKAQRGSRLHVKGLSVLHELPSDIPHTKVLLVADRRWKWARRWILRRYNIRRKTGDRRKVGEAPGSFEQLADTVDKIGYALYSLDGLNPWQAKDTIVDVLRAVDAADPTFDGELSSDTIPIEGLEIDDPGDTAVGKTLGFIPGTGVYVDYDGKTHLYNTRTAAERGIVQNAGPRIVGGGIDPFVDFSRIRPSKIRIFYTPEYELRMDVASADSTAKPAEDRREIVNVVPIPDPTLSVDGVNLVAGTVITLAQAITAWNQDLPPFAIAGKQVIDVPALTDQIIRQTMTNIANMMNIYVGVGVQTPDVNWALRVAAIRQNYRTLYRINRHWMDRFLAIRANLAATIDPVTGLRAKARVYNSFSMKPSERGTIAEPRSARMGINVISHPGDKGYPNSRGTATDPLADGRHAPAEMIIADPDLGLIQIQFRQDSFGRWAEMVPSLIDNIPTADIDDKSRVRAWNESDINTARGIPELTATHFCSLLFSAIPASPNDERQLYAVEVTPSDVKSAYPGLGELGPCNGPEMELRVGPSVTTARFAWFDELSNLTEEAFGVFATAERELEVTSLTENGRKENPDTTKELLTNEKELFDVAVATAAVIYSGNIDRLQGQRTVRMLPGVVPAGNLQAVTHRLGPSGDATTTLALPAEPPKVDVFAMMDHATRRTLMRLADYYRGSR